jgi:hypothetical protein
MARASLIPDHLKGANYEVTFGNCFMISNLAATWGLDPFAVAQASALVFGKIVLEGKLVRAVIRKFLGFDLNYAWFGNPGNMDRVCYVSDRPLVVDNPDSDNDGDPLTQDQIEALMKRKDWRITKGNLGKWHTKSKSGGINDNWAKDEDKMFRERGAREWCREYSPGLMLGVYTPDDFDEVEANSRSNRARDITPARNPLLDDAPKTTEEQPGTSAKQTQAGRATSDKPSSPSVDGEAGNATGNQPQTNSSDDSQSSSLAAGDSTGGDGGPSSPVGTLTRAVFTDFLTTIIRFKSEESVKKGAKQFFDENGVKPGNQTEYDLFATIKNQFVESVLNGKVTIEDFKVEATGWINDDVPEGEKL